MHIIPVPVLSNDDVFAQRVYTEFASIGNRNNHDILLTIFKSLQNPLFRQYITDFGSPSSWNNNLVIDLIYQ